VGKPKAQAIDDPLLAQGSCWTSGTKDLVLTEVIPSTKSLVFWEPDVRKPGRLKLIKLSFEAFSTTFVLQRRAF